MLLRASSTELSCQRPHALVTVDVIDLKRPTPVPSSPPCQIEPVLDPLPPPASSSSSLELPVSVAPPAPRPRASLITVGITSPPPCFPSLPNHHKALKPSIPSPPLTHKPRRRPAGLAPSVRCSLPVSVLCQETQSSRRLLRALLLITDSLRPGKQEDEAAGWKRNTAGK
ncbi:hypothetical protein M0R45_033938 [Rubus argutus]|uniref:Uncharacterized protein n=1 Tax=Rubus argutus TaxID=59490 RepID=A0AAW1VPV4_RUBAR